MKIFIRLLKIFHLKIKLRSKFIRKIKLALKDLIGKEDKKKPMSDDALTKALAKLGYPIARRTVAKYREQLGLPVARLRKA